jgi:hypothetical protein
MSMQGGTAQDVIAFLKCQWQLKSCIQLSVNNLTLASNACTLHPGQHPVANDNGYIL